VTANSGKSKSSGQIVFVAGARPNFMKVAPVIRELKRRNAPFEAQLVHTGQHYDDFMSDVFFGQLGIPRPDAYLRVGSAPHGAQTGRILEAFERYLLDFKVMPRGVVVVGDVNSTMAAALAAVKLGIPVAHVEAGLRSFDRTMPEEINRLVTDAVADLLLVSEPAGLENLRNEGIGEEKIRFVGNVMIDTLVHELEAAKVLGISDSSGLSFGEYAYLTLHRPSNVDEVEKLEGIVEFLAWMAERLPVVFPVHPRTRKRLEEFGLSEKLVKVRGIKLMEPIGYRESLCFMASSRLVLTDSGGIQEETSYLGIPCLTLRPNTERPVTVTEGTNTIVGDDLSRAKSLVEDILAGRYKTGKAISGWDGRASERIVDAFVEKWT
jgi:UDP-N-acetylglucosamine 2-epimerase (non-hydrolysing)